MSRPRLSRLSALGERLAGLLITGRRLNAARAKVATLASRWALVEALQPTPSQGAKSAIGDGGADGRRYQGIRTDGRSAESPIANDYSGRLHTLVTWHPGFLKRPGHREFAPRNRRATGQFTDVALAFRDRVIPTPLERAISSNALRHLPTRQTLGALGLWPDTLGRVLQLLHKLLNSTKAYALRGEREGRVSKGRSGESTLQFSGIESPILNRSRKLRNRLASKAKSSIRGAVTAHRYSSSSGRELSEPRSPSPAPERLWNLVQPSSPWCKWSPVRSCRR
jgi:hypothetical protein